MISVSTQQNVAPFNRVFTFIINAELDLVKLSSDNRVGGFLVFDTSKDFDGFIGTIVSNKPTVTLSVKNKEHKGV